MVSEKVIDVIGGLGGGFLAVCLIPQLHRMYKTRSAADLSYWWTAAYVGGISCTLVYLALLSATVGWICHTIELALALTLFASKLYLDSPYNERRPHKVAAASELQSVAVQGGGYPESGDGSLVASFLPSGLVGGAQQYAGCHASVECRLQPIVGRQANAEFSAWLLSVMEDSLMRTHTQLRFKHAELVMDREAAVNTTGDDVQVNPLACATPGVSIVAIHDSGHVMAEWYCDLGQLYIDVLWGGAQDGAKAAGKVRETVKQLKQGILARYPGVHVLALSDARGKS